MNLTPKDIINLALRYISENEIADFPEEEDLYNIGKDTIIPFPQEKRHKKK